jgi:hypothetical protein
MPPISRRFFRERFSTIDIALRIDLTHGIQYFRRPRPSFFGCDAGTIPHSSTFRSLGWDCSLIEFGYSTARRHMPTDLAIKLNVLAIGMAFAFVGAILFGAF